MSRLELLVAGVLAAAISFLLGAHWRYEADATARELGSAWAEAEALLPVDWRIWLKPTLLDDGWVAEARIKGVWYAGAGPLPSVEASAATRPEALRALAFALRRRR